MGQMNLISFEDWQNWAKTEETKAFTTQLKNIVDKALVEYRLLEKDPSQLIKHYYSHTGFIDGVLRAINIIEAIKEGVMENG